MQTKICNICKIEKTINEFFNNKGHKYGVDCRCKTCNQKRKRELYKPLEHIYRKYGITIEHYYNILETQNNLCAICKRELKKPVIDHDHNTGKVRGILCYPCNTAIGKSIEALDLLKKAYDYLVNLG